MTERRERKDISENQKGMIGIENDDYDIGISLSQSGDYSSALTYFKKLWKSVKRCWAGIIFISPASGISSLKCILAKVIIPRHWNGMKRFWPSVKRNLATNILRLPPPTMTSPEYMRAGEITPRRLNAIIKLWKSVKRHPSHDYLSPMSTTTSPSYMEAKGIA